MTEAEQATVEAAGEALRTRPRPWAQLTGQERAVLTAALMPEPSFTPDQRDYLRRWCLECPDAATVDAINAVIPPEASTVLVPRADVTGALFIGADVLSDALGDGPLAPCLPLLEKLTLRHKTPEEWPVPTLIY